MTMPSVQRNFIATVQQASRQVLALRDTLSQIRIMYYGAGDFDDAITQENIDSVATFQEAELTVSHITEAAYSLGLVLDDIDDRLVPLTILANLP